jgi:anti-sigma factor RsiW
MTTTRNNDTPVHPDISSLIPWYVNGSIDEHERQRVDEHLTLCPECREEVARERWIHQQMTAENAVEHMPVASLNRLQVRLDGIHTEELADAHAAALGPASAEPVRGSMPWAGLMAASIAVMAVALSVLAADRWMQYGAQHAAAPVYRTTTTSAQRAPNEAIRAVFSPALTLNELQAILDEAQLRIVSGPTEAGVYSLAANSRRPVSSSLTLLRGHAEVRFAESTQPGAGPGDSP